jgi:hypothetical protein
LVEQENVVDRDILNGRGAVLVVAHLRRLLDAIEPGHVRPPVGSGLATVLEGDVGI